MPLCAFPVWPLWCCTESDASVRNWNVLIVLHLPVGRMFLSHTSGWCSITHNHGGCLFSFLCQSVVDECRALLYMHPMVWGSGGFVLSLQNTNVSLKESSFQKFFIRSGVVLVVQVPEVAEMEISSRLVGKLHS